MHEEGGHTAQLRLRSTARRHPSSRTARWSADMPGSKRRGLETPVGPPQRGQFRLIVPEGDRQPGEVGGTEGRGLGDARTHDRDPEQVGLELQQQVVCGSPAIDPQFTQPLPTVQLHRAEDLDALEGDRFECRARDMGAAGAARHAEQCATRVRIPVRRPETGVRRDEVDATTVGDRRRQAFDLVGAGNHSETIAQPLNDGAAHEDTAFEEIGRLVAQAPADRRQHPSRSSPTSGGASSSPGRRYSGAGSSPCHRCSLPCRARGRPGRRSPPAGRRRCRRVLPRRRGGHRRSSS